MNQTKIEWASLNTPGGGYTWNPIVGCTNGCPYCYARATAPSVARRVASVTGEEPCPDCLTFTPHLHPERLDQPAQRRTPSGVFVGSMCDLWDPCVRAEWREKVWQAMADAPQHRYALLTKRPGRVYSLPNADVTRLQLAVGVSITSGREAWRAERLGEIDVLVRFVSFEPLQGSCLTRQPQQKISDWAIIGAETGKRPGRVVPEWSWVEEIMLACDELQIPVFLKDNLRQYAPEGFAWRQEWPEVWA